MPTDYIKSAMDKIMRHDNWDKYAKDYELSLAKTLHNDTAVIQAAQKALFRMSKVLTAYYGSGETETLPESSEDMEIIAENTKSIVEEGGGNTGEREQAVPDDKIEINPTLAESFLRKDKSSAGQIRAGDDYEQNRASLDAVVNQDGNLREKMTAMFNASLFNSRDSKKTVKNMANTISSTRARELGLNMNAITQDRSVLLRQDIMDMSNMAMSSTSFLKHPIRLMSYIMGGRARRRLYDDEKTALGESFYKDNQMELSQREKTAATMADDKGNKDFGWKEGIFYNGVDSDSRWVRTRRARGFRLLTGPSGTTTRMLRAYKWLGASEEDLVQFRLALAGWMLAGDHSLYEIVTGAKQAGVRPEEDTTNAISLYKTFAPLSPGYLRGNVAVDRQFPDEHVFRDVMLEDEKDRAAMSIDRETDYEKGTNEKLSAANHAVYGYTTDLYKVMNPGVSKGISAANKKNVFLRMDNLYGQLSSKMLLDSMPFMKKEKGKTVYRATSAAAFLSKFSRVGSKIKTSTFTSTSKQADTPINMFYKSKRGIARHFVKPVLMEIALNGHGAVDTQPMSQYAGEAEITLMPGTELRVDQALHRMDISQINNEEAKTAMEGRDLSELNVVRLTEVGNKNNKYDDSTPESEHEAQMADPVSLKNPEPLDLSSSLRLNAPMVEGEDSAPEQNVEDMMKTIGPQTDYSSSSLTADTLQQANFVVYGILANELTSSEVKLPKGAYEGENRLLDAFVYVVSQYFGDSVIFGGIANEGGGYFELADAVREIMQDDTYNAALEDAYLESKKAEGV